MLCVSLSCASVPLSMVLRMSLETLSTGNCLSVAMEVVHLLTMAILHSLVKLVSSDVEIKLQRAY